jgi:hypothetical protein
MFDKAYRQITGPNGLQRLERLVPDNCRTELGEFEQAVAKLGPLVNDDGPKFGENDLPEINAAIASSHVPVWALSQLSFVRPGIGQAALICQKALIGSFNDAGESADLVLLEATAALGKLAMAIIRNGKPAAKDSDLLPMTIITNYENALS